MSWRRWLGASKPAEPTREEVIAGMLRDGFLHVELSDKSRKLLADDVTEMDEYTYWVVRSRVLEAKRLVESQFPTI